jgi:uncharacterized membrane protein
MSACGSCGEVSRVGNTIYIGQLRDEHDEQGNCTPRRVGLLAKYTTKQYVEKLDRVLAETDELAAANAMFDAPEQHETMSEKEMRALGAYALAGRLSIEALRDVTEEGGMPVIAYENMNDLVQQQLVAA